MSTVDSTTIQGTLAVKYADEVTNIFNRKARLAGLIAAKDGGSWDLNWAVRDTDGQVASTSSYLADGTDVTVFNTDALGKAHLEFATLSEGFAITEKAMAEAKAAGNPAQLANLAADEMKNAADRLFSNMNKELWKGTGAGAGTSNPKIAGLLDATNGALMADGVYGGIDRGTITAWGSNQIDMSAAAIDEAAVIAQLSLIDKVGGRYPSAIVTSYKQRDALAAVLKDNQRFTIGTAAATGVTLSGGYTGLSVSGCPVIADKDCADAEMAFLSLDTIELFQMPPANTDNAGVMVMPNGIKLYVIPLAYSGGARKFQLRCFVQLKVRRPNEHGALTNLG